MIRHIVLWRLKENAHASEKSENAQKIKEMLESLNGKMPGMRSLVVGICDEAGETHADLALVADFDSWEALEAYQDAPEHVVMKAFIMEARAERRVADFEM